MSDELAHIIVGDLIGEAVACLPDSRISKPFITAVLAFASHAVLDRADNDYTINWTDADRLKHDAPLIAVQTSGLAAEIASLLTEKDREKAVIRLAGVLGSIAPDVIDGVYAYLHPDKWQKGDLFMPWHKICGSKGKPQTMEQAINRGAMLTLMRVGIRF